MQYLTLECPFCKKGKIEIIYFPPTVKFVKGSWGGGKSEGKMSSDSTIIKTEKCPDCGASKKDIKKALNHGKQIPHEEKLKRAKEGGMPTSIETPITDKAEYDDDYMQR
ncbi:MAG: hypothetical protein ABH873_07960 [Candidatus Firestonebacteria bacterium]